MPQPRILIAGAGIGGLTAALALLQRGFEVAIFEQAAELHELGAGIQLGPNGSRILIGLGLGEAMRRVVAEPAGKEVRLWNTGETWNLFDLGRDCRERFGAPYWMVHRGDFHRVLREAVEAASPGSVHLSSRAVACRERERTIALQLADGREVEGNVVIGADGVHSRMRAHLFDAARPRFTGLMAWRGVVPIERLPAELRRPVGANWHGPGGHVVTYPLRGGSLLNFVGVVERNDWFGEAWMEQGSKEECATDFAGWHPLVHAIIDSLDAAYKWALIGRAPMTAWSRGRATLLGDACHPTLPFMAQGAIMAMEDGVILARCLEAQGDDIPAALQRYESLRLERTTRVVLGSAANTQRFHNAVLADPVEAPRYMTREYPPDRGRTLYDWLFEYDALTAPI
ncbi:MAG TPA: FAD-dependent monooxygenase [Hyphomicrobiaceae bacterium]|nr:FAD-dependent monooxygenase [Hyphomicrobiaceae bacterium]